MTKRLNGQTAKQLTLKSYKIEVYGRVQAVGFRPFVFNLARQFNLNGYVKNRTSYVEIFVQGEQEDVFKFINMLKSTHPPQAVVDEFHIKEVQNDVELTGFLIAESEDSQVETLFIPAEIKICNECLNELFNTRNRRYLYPFINCTQCGPRFTIIKTLPYDRQNTTMDVFQMCDECYKEYTDPSNRRFHAEPNACHRCGPGLEVKKIETEKVERVFGITGSPDDVEEILDFVVKELLDGKIFAIKSYGGYHLVCDATNDDAVIRLRKNKYREYKPFAMMAADVETIEKYCYVSKEEKQLLESPQAPIVLLLKKQCSNIQQEISQYVAPKSKYYGFMLPYTPLQYMIFTWLKKLNKNIPLVMTSGNISDEPQVYKDEDAIDKLGNIADYILTYNREIRTRCDDSVVLVVDKNLYFIRRSRGWSPEPVSVNYNFKKRIISFGADLKNTFALAWGSSVVVSHHIGDLDNVEAIDSFTSSVEYYIETFKHRPEVVVYDMHPGYVSSKVAIEFAKRYSAEVVPVQHHYAHMLSCMLDNSLYDKTIGVIFDGTGYGVDGTIWGSEFFVGDIYGFSRKAFFDYLTLVGGDDGIRKPYKTLIAFMCEEFQDLLEVELLLKKIFDRYGYEKNFFVDYRQLCNSIRFLLDNKINVTKVCGMGRIFDIVAVLCGVGTNNYYEGQLPQELEFYATKHFDEVVKNNYFYEYEINKKYGTFVVDSRKIIKQILYEIVEQKLNLGVIAAKFHHTVSKITVDVVRRIAELTGIENVVISGGVFQNRLIFCKTVELLRNNGFRVFTNKTVPCNDAGICFGQVLKGGVS